MLVFVVVAAGGIAARAVEANRLKHSTQTNAIQPVTVMTVEKGAPTEEVVLPGTVQAWHDATVYARTAGYLKNWNAEIGAKVKEGEVLATIDAPDLDAQFHQAQADLKTAMANNNIAQLTAKRYIELRKTDSVSQQQADTFAAQAAADEAAVESAKANLDHLQQEENFKQVVAPFDGTVTQRNTDNGALINGGNTGAATPTNSAVTGQDLFHIADISKLRVYVQVPENDAPFVTQGLKAELHFPEHPDLVAEATLDHTADALDPTTRTVLVEFEVDNPDGKLLSGGYTDVHIKMPTAQETVIVPVNTMLFRTKMQVAIVGQDNHVMLKDVTIGRDYGKTIEVVSGLSPGDTIVVNPPDSLQDKQEVKPIKPDDNKDDGKSQSTSQDSSKDQDKSKDKDKKDKAQ
jgi:RND family efflux transporter MFP subunit